MRRGLLGVLVALVLSAGVAAQQGEPRFRARVAARPAALGAQIPDLVINGPAALTTAAAAQTLTGSWAAFATVAGGGITWTCDNCTATSGTATFTPGFSGAWSVAVTLGDNLVNAICVTVTDTQAMPQERERCVTYTHETPDSVEPVVSITGPTTQPTFTTTASSISLSGTCGDDIECTALDYECVGCSDVGVTYQATFTVSNHIDLSAYTPEIGDPCVEVFDNTVDSHNYLRVSKSSDDVAPGSGTSSDTGLVYTCGSAAGGSNYDLQVTVNTEASGSQDVGGLVFSYVGTGAADLCAVAVYRPANTPDLVLFKRTSNTVATLDTADVWAAVGDQNGAVITVEARGNDIAVIVGGVTRLSITDADCNQSSTFGLFAGNLRVATDDKPSSPRFDNLTAADVGGSGSTSGSGTLIGSGTSKTWTTPLIPLSDGSQTITITACDAEMNCTPRNLVVTKGAGDVTAPTVTITTPTTDPTLLTATTPITIGGTCTDAGGCTVVDWTRPECSPTSGTATGLSSWQIANLALCDGTNTLTVRGRDAAGNQGTDGLTLTLSTALAVTSPTALSPAEVGSAYSRVMTASGGTPPYTWDNNGGGTSLNDADAECAGLAIAGNGTVSGTPSANGTCSWTSRVTDDDMTTATKAHTIAVAAMGGGGGGNDYFDALKVLPTVHPVAICASTVPADNGACSYRNDTQLNQLAQQSDQFNEWSYVFGADPYPTPQDGGKLTQAGGTNGSVRSQLRPIVGLNSGRILMTWDYWIGPEWRPTTQCGGVIQPDSGGAASYNHKEFQLAAGFGPTTAGDLNFEIQTRYTNSANQVNGGLSCDFAGRATVRLYGASGIPPGMSSDVNPVSSCGPSAVCEVNLPHSQWIRYIVEMRPNVDGAEFTEWSATYMGGVPLTGTWHMYSVWICTESSACQRMIYRIPLGLARGTYLARLWDEHNTSSKAGALAGDAFSYIRNLVVLHNYVTDGESELVESDPLVFQQPVP